MLKMFGIKNCDTVRKARSFLKDNNIDYEFIDLRDDGINAKQISSWCETLDWEALLNRRSKTWRDLAETDKTNIDKTRAIKLMAKHPTLIKRPVLQTSKEVLTGFNEQEYRQITG